MTKKNSNIQLARRSSSKPNFDAMEWKSLFNKSQMEVAEKRERADKWGVSRRITMAFLTLSSRQARKGFGSDNPDQEEVTLAAFEQMLEYQKYLKARLELTETAIGRLIVASGCADILEKPNRKQSSNS
ncbi:MAG: hypothetical protein AB7R90_10435 [Reyranellaceae bacterium]